MNKIKIAALGAVALAALLFAHAGVSGHAGFVNGLRHPVCGPDHVLAMIGAGVWTALALPANRMLLAPLAFAAAILTGTAAGITGVPFAGVEAGMAISIVAMGLMLFAGVKLPAALAAILIGAFGMMHGYLHGAVVDGAILAYVIGFTLTAAVLQLAGSGIGRGFVNWRTVTSVAGGATAAAGISLLVA